MRRRAAYDGNAIVVASGNTWIHNNVIWDIVSHVIDVYQDFNVPTANNVFVWNNTFYTAVGTRYSAGRTGGGSGLGGYPASFEERNNIFLNPDPTYTPIASNYECSAADFVGPLSGTAAAGPGSGFRLTGTSGAVGAAAELPLFNHDKENVLRGDTWDHGAYER